MQVQITQQQMQTQVTQTNEEGLRLITHEAPLIICNIGQSTSMTQFTPGARAIKTIGNQLLKPNHSQYCVTEMPNFYQVENKGLTSEQKMYALERVKHQQYLKTSVSTHPDLIDHTPIASGGTINRINISLKKSLISN